MELASKIEDSLPRNFSIDEMKKDVELYESLYSIIQSMTLLMEKLNDTQREIGAEAYISALTVYNTAKQAGDDAGGLEAVLDELGKRFARKSSKIST